MSTIEIPSLHEEPMASVLSVLRLEPVDNYLEGSQSFTGNSLPQERLRVYGGQVLAQVILAAGATVDSNRQIHCLQASFLRSGVFTQNIRFDVDLSFDGRSFSSRAVQAKQSGGTICSGLCSFQLPQDGLEHCQSIPADVPGPDGLGSNLDVFREIRTPVAKYLGKTTAFEVRHVKSNLYFEPAKDTDNRQMLWIRPRVKLPEQMPQILHRALLSYICDQVMLEPVLRANGLYWALDGMSLATLNHTQYFFAPVNINDWHLFVGNSPVSTGSRGIAQCDIFSASGRQVSSIMQEGMIRVPTSQNSTRGKQFTFQIPAE